MNPSENQRILLSLVSSALFEAEASLPANPDWDALLQEAMEQAVLPLIYERVSGVLPMEQKKRWDKTVSLIMAKNLTVSYEHTELHELLSEHHIPYVILKGSASGAYYPSPMLRTYGDVDFLVREDDIERVCRLAEGIGFIPEEDRAGIHVALHRDDSVWEMHRAVNGIPGGACGERIHGYMETVIQSAVDCEDENGTIKIPSTFHHGLILLLHTASHLTSEGVGLRHLCDWVVFAETLTEEEFAALFEERLKACGLWRFAQLLTLCGVQYLNAPPRAWAGEADPELVGAILGDILCGGNFGKKDADRYRQIKYISNREDRGVDDKNVLYQLWETLGQKAKAEKKSRLAVMVDYGMMVLRGQRRLDDRQTLAGADARKRIYQEFHLFESHAGKR